MKGQIRVEFIFGVVIFGIIIFFIASQLNTIFTTVLTDSRTDTIRAKSINILTLLIEDKGNPEDWEIKPLSQVKRIGLANKPYDLSINKIMKLNENCNLLEKFDLKSYRLKIFDSNGQILFCGYESLEPPTVLIIRYVLIDGEFGNISLEMW